MGFALMHNIHNSLFSFALLAALSACSSEASTTANEHEVDPLLVRALNVPLMTDLDLASQNEANAALTIGFEQSLPPIDRSIGTIAAARDEARFILLDAGDIPDLPKAQAQPDLVSLGPALTAEARANLFEFTGDCAAAVEYSAVWAARLPDFARIVPRGAVVEAAGVEEARCKIRSVTYLTPLSVDDILTFHYTQASRAGLSPVVLEGDEHAIHGEGSMGALALHVEARENGLYAVHIVTSTGEGSPG